MLTSSRGENEERHGGEVCEEYESFALTRQSSACLGDLDPGRQPPPSFASSLPALRCSVPLTPG